MTLALGAALLAALGYAVASVLQAVGVRDGASPRDLVRSPLYLTGLGADGISWLLSLLALRRLPAFAVQALLAGSLAITVLLARLLLRAVLRRRDVAAVAVMVGALAVVGGAGREQPAPAAGGVVVVVLAAAAALVLLVAPLLRRAPSAARSKPRRFRFSATLMRGTQPLRSGSSGSTRTARAWARSRLPS